ncbi:aminotransferase class I/II-fold pyridoxal phosphate-dependent enzyme [Dehalococcoides mccartyi]|uniref:Aminotransferase, classes I and II n=1 Tax=Dehalococcoides mccartyi (strain CBDB1) TaxID=255470 RepID=A0A916NUM3_DEHMC|nr:aminotransferase class I/II-fold pyridoxal phosphate-dependent enzyme [Dehalococcoides mccartyi]CAI82737.1 aminotransferase, classes I and II [Dehalococcoides mccartyi CBDB1]
MDIKPFELERYFAKHEFSARYLMSSSDCESLGLEDLLSLADAECRSLWQNLKLGYTYSDGYPLLRKEIAKLYEHITPSDILTTVPEEGIFIALNCLLEKGDHVICTFPGYQSLYQLAESLGCEVSYWKPEEENGWRFNPEFLSRNIRPNTRLIITNFPHNPTGAMPDTRDYALITEIISQHNLWHFSDEMYRLLEYSPQNRLPAACDKSGMSVSLGGLSKSFGLPGLRSGWLACRDKDMLSKMAGFKDYTTICGSATAEILSIIALRNKDTIVSAQLGRLNQNLKLLEGFMGRHKQDFSWVKPKAGSVCFPRLNKITPCMDFCQQVLEKTGIMILPSEVYNYGQNHFRIGFGRANFPEVLEIFENFITAYPARSKGLPEM